MALSAKINLYLITVIKYVKETLSLLFIATAVRDSALQQVYTAHDLDSLESGVSVLEGEAREVGPLPLGHSPRVLKPPRGHALRTVASDSKDQRPRSASDPSFNAAYAFMKHDNDVMRHLQ